MRSGGATLGLLLGAAVALSGRTVLASDCSPTLESPCINSDILWPHAGPSRFVGVGGTETVEAGRVGFGLFTSYLSRPVVLRLPAPGPGGSTQYAIDNQVNGTFLWAYGITSRLELDLALPLTFIQDGSGLAPLTGGAGLNDTAVRDLRFGLSLSLVPHARALPEERPEAFGLLARLEVSAPTGDATQLAGEGTGVFAPSLAGDWRSGRLSAGVELGARLRPTHELLGGRIGSQLVTAIGVGYDVLPRELLTASVEAWALPTLVQQDSLQQVGQALVATPDGKYIAPAEWQVALRTAPLADGDLALQLGGGGGLPITDGSFTMPRFRFTLGVRWAPAGRQAAKVADGGSDLHLAAGADPCPSEPDLVDGFKEADGCPDEDQDRDGVPDRLDRCPMVPEDFVGLTDGCPEKR